MQKRVMPLLLAAALMILGGLSILTIHKMQGNARVINYAGVVRGGTQRLVKQEISGHPNDALVDRLDGILSELATGKGENGLSRLDDPDFQRLISRMQKQWENIKEEIQDVRKGTDNSVLYEESESYFVLADQTVFAAETYSEKQVSQTERGLLILSGGFLLVLGALVWYWSLQARRQKELTAAEERNRKESVQLARMSEDLQACMNELSELIYISDIENYELLFINEAGRKSFNITKLEGQKCYQVLQGLDAPCEFCKTSYLKEGENFTWEITNSLTKRHYLLKDRLVQWDGRPAKMEIAFDVTEAEEEKRVLKNTLDSEQMVMECVRTLYQERDSNKSFSSILESLGCFMSAGQAYIAVLRDGLLHMDYTWCSEEEASVKEFLWEIPQNILEWFKDGVTRQGYVLLEDVEELKERSPKEYQLLKKQGTHCLVAIPLEREGELKGILAVHNFTLEWIQGTIPLLQTLCYFLMLTERRNENEHELSRLSYFDTLTSFYNRNRYMEDTRALETCEGAVGIVYLDVNGLKDINDQQGHAVGDKVLVECTKLMREIFEEADYYRIGGDEFVIICLHIDRLLFEVRVAALRRCFSENEICKVAIGEQWNESFKDLQQIIAKADAKMYEDKKEYYRQNPVSNRYRHLSDEMLHLSSAETLQEEIRQERFVVYLQPKVSAADGSAVGAEALIRYQSRTGSLVMPGNFLPMLEEGRTVSQIDFYVFEYACTRLKEWIIEGKRAHPISINFSRCSLSQADFVKRLSSLCQKYGVEKKYLEIELTETAREADGVDIKGLISELREDGFIVSIDDFGTEYANLTLLSSVEFDILKLDKSLVDDVAYNPKARTVVKSIVDICRKMQIGVVAEGIETEEQLTALRSCGVELVQGYLFSRPIPIEEYEERYL